jgi:hypothetical protein
MRMIGSARRMIASPMRIDAIRARLLRIRRPDDVNTSEHCEDPRAS